MNSTKSISAAELIARLQKDPEWVQKDAEREIKRKAKEAELRADEAPLIIDLDAVGIKVVSVWDLVNSSANYADAIPVLYTHLSRAYRAETKEGIARALTVVNARGSAARFILCELQSSLEKNTPHSVRWALANALTVVADSSMVKEIKTMISDNNFKDIHERLKVALRTALKPFKEHT